MGRHSAPTRRAGRDRAAALTGARLRRLSAVGAGAAVLSATVGFVGLGKQVEVVIDGRQQTVTTYASDVEGVLVDAGVRPASQDAVTPALDSPVTDGSVVSLVQSRPVTVVVDGAEATHTVTAYTVEEAVAQLGLTDHEIVSASRAGRLPLTDAEIELETYHEVTVLVDSTELRVSTTADDVDGALQDAGVALGPQDVLTPSGDTAVVPGMSVQVTRIGQHTVTETRSVAHQVVEQPDPEQYVGISTVLSPGVDGTETVTFAVSTTDGVETGRTEIARQVTAAPADEVVGKGAKQFPADVDALNWQSLGHCESTNNPKAVNQTNGKYFGEYQFSFETWAGVGGTGNPADAPAEEQLARAKMLYMMCGAGQWECGSHLYD